MNFSVDVRVTETGAAGKYRNYTIDSDLDGEQTLADLLNFTKGALITIAQDVLKEEQKDGFDSKPTLIVDGKFNRSIYDVHPLGKIQYVARQSLREIIEYTYEAIAARTKIVTGEYGRHNIVTFNGKQVANTRSSLRNWLDSERQFESKDVIRFVNTAPYARKLERQGVTAQRTNTKQETHKKATGKGKGRTFGRKALLIPNGVYTLACKAVKSKYKNNSFIAFRFLDGSQIGFFGTDRSEKTGKPNRRTYKKGKSAGRSYFYPSILISAVTAGITDGGQ